MLSRVGYLLRPKSHQKILIGMISSEEMGASEKRKEAINAFESYSNELSKKCYLEALCSRANEKAYPGVWNASSRERDTRMLRKSRIIADHNY